MDDNLTAIRSCWLRRHFLSGRLLCLLLLIVADSPLALEVKHAWLVGGVLIRLLFFLNEGWLDALEWKVGLIANHCGHGHSSRDLLVFGGSVLLLPEQVAG